MEAKTTPYQLALKHPPQQTAYLHTTTDQTMMPTLWKLATKRYQYFYYISQFPLLINVNTLKIVDMLPAKTVPEVKNKEKQTLALKLKTVTVPQKKKVRACLVQVEEIEDEDSM